MCVDHVTPCDSAVGSCDPRGTVPCDSAVESCDPGGLCHVTVQWNHVILGGLCHVTVQWDHVILGGLCHVTVQWDHVILGGTAPCDSAVRSCGPGRTHLGFSSVTWLRRKLLASVMVVPWDELEDVEEEAR